MDWIREKMSEVEAEMNTSMTRASQPGTPAPAAAAAASEADTESTSQLAPSAEETVESTPAAERPNGRRITPRSSGDVEPKPRRQDVEVNLSEILGNADTPPAGAAKPKSRLSSTSTPTTPATPTSEEATKKLKRMAIRLKKENEALKASVAKAEEQAAAATSQAADATAAVEAATAARAAAEQAQAEAESRHRAAENAADDAKAELTKFKKLAAGLKKKNSQLVEKLETKADAAAAVDDSALDELREQLAQAAARVAALTSELAAEKAERAAAVEAKEAAAAQADDQVKSLRALLSAQAEDARRLAREREVLQTEGEVLMQRSAAPVAAEGDASDAVADLEANVTSLEAMLEEERTRTKAASADRAVEDDKDGESGDAVAALRAELAALKEGGGGGGQLLADSDETMAALREELSALKATVADGAAAAAAEGEAARQLEEVTASLVAKDDEHKKELDTVLAMVQAAKDREQQLSSELDRVQEELGVAAEGTIRLEQELADERQAAAQKAAELGKEVLGLREEKDRQATDGDDAIKELASECTTLRTQVQQLEVAKARLETLLSAEKDALTAAKAKLAQATAGKSQQAMLDLELADYKRTAESLNTRIKELGEELVMAKKTNTEAEARAAETASAQAKELEIKKKGEESRVKMKAMLLQLKKEVTSRRDEAEKTDKAMKELQGQLEAKTQEVESLKTEFAEINMQLTAIEAEKRELETTKDVEMHSVKFELETARRELSQAQSQAAESSRELGNYKARAHTLLKQKQDEEQTTSKDDLEREMAAAAALREEVVSLRSDLDTANAQLADAEGELDELAAKFEQTSRSAEQQQQVAAAKVQALQDATVAAQQERMDELGQLRMEHSMALRTMREKHAKTAADTARKQTDLEKQVTELRGKLREALDAAASDGSVGGAAETTAASTAADSGRLRASSGGGAVAATAVTATPTAAAADSVGPSAGDPLVGETRGKVDLVAKVSDLATLLVTPPAAAPVAAQSQTEAKLAAAERHIEHMATLLAESESSTERLAEQSKVLKAEIRRYEANTSRDASSNLEYIKNVVYKFITAEDEREQLIPVLGMLLHFSTDELREATRGFVRVRRAEQERAAAAAAGGSAWGVFPRWS